GSTVFNTLVRGNYIGVNKDGDQDLGNSANGVLISAGAVATIIGGSTSAARNVISGNGSSGIGIVNSDGTILSGNYIGTNQLGSSPIGNVTGISLVHSQASVLGGTTPGAGNVISGNSGYVVTLGGITSLVAYGNTIGLDAAAT
ncbi:hypothetical protein, partial [Bradyrhizobium sp. NBAIM08]|uniref:hypothetical protein n=1 Tax=Bradyrhizobium sp. NBAIM08 TaxID=2793815 RepID=UPI001CD2BBFF